MTGSVTAVLLAGQRDGAVDPLAQAAGTTLKCLVPVAGRPMILHAFDALSAAPSIGPIIISANKPEDLAALDGVMDLLDQGRVRLVRSRPNLVDSVLDAVAEARFPVMVATADSVLLTPAMVEAFLHDAKAGEVAVALATRDAVLAAHAEGQRRFYRFRDDAYANCNTYWLRSRESLRPIEAFRGGGQFIKYPRRIAEAFGVLNFLAFMLGVRTLDATFRGLSRRFGRLTIPVVVADGAMAIDADNQRTVDVIEDVLMRRSSRQSDPVRSSAGISV